SRAQPSPLRARPSAARAAGRSYKARKTALRAAPPLCSAPARARTRKVECRAAPARALRRSRRSRRAARGTNAPPSIGLDAVLLDDLAPARHLSQEKLLSRFGAGGDDVHAEDLGERLFHVGLIEGLVQLRAHFVDDRLGRA